MNMFGGDDIDAVITGGGITFKGGPKREPNPREQAKVKTKAKKKQYITGAHGSGAAKKKADIRRQRQIAIRNEPKEYLARTLYPFPSSDIRSGEGLCYSFRLWAG